MNPRTVTVAAVVVAAAFGLAGCSGGATPDTPSAVAPPLSTPTVAPPGAEPGASPTTGATAGSADPQPSPSPDPTTPPASTSSDTAQPTLTYAGVGGAGYQLSGLVTNLVEDGGTCTFTLSLGSKVVQRTQAGLADASSTSCGTVDVAASELTPGTWSAVLSYAGPGGSGTSPSIMVQVS